MLRPAFLCNLALLLPLTLLAAPALASGKSGKKAGVVVDRLTFPVTLSDQNPYTIVAYHYHSHHARGGSECRPLQVLVHGAGYDHRYWDAGVVNGAEYSYARYMATAGFDVIAVDQLGAGESSQPPGFYLGLDQAANGLRQVLVSLRSKKNPAGRRFGSVALVGHSNGSLTSIYEESQNHLADALVVTGWGHTYAPLPVNSAAFAPLFQSPYLPATAFSAPLRALLFYHLPSADPAVVAYDAANLASTMATKQLLDLLTVTFTPTLDGVANVTGPVLVQLGDHDVIAPAANASSEPSYWTSASSITVQTLADMGHDVNLHLNRLESWPLIRDWINTTLCDDEGDDD